MNTRFRLSIAAALVGCGLLISCTPKPLAPQDAQKELARLMRKVSWSSSVVTQGAAVTPASAQSVADSLPDIDTYPIVVDSQSQDAVVAEIFSSTEKSGSGTDGALVEIAKGFNDRRLKTRSGRIAQVQIRSIPSGTAYEYIAYGKYIPDGFTPSNHLWIQMVKAAGVSAQPISESLVGNTAGIVMKEEAYKTLEKKYGSVDVRAIIDATVAGELAMGYTNPFASSTGLNFLVTVLSSFAKGDETKMLSPEVVSAFEAFQKGVPFVALTTMQMRDSVEKGGSLGAFIMEHQTYLNTAALKSGWKFIPFGFTHDNPLYAVGAPDSEKRETMELFAEFTQQSWAKGVADRYGFNRSLAFQPLSAFPSGDTLVRAQRLWKEKKDVGRPIVAVFLTDVSGSMAGLRIKNLKEALEKGSAYIDPRNSIGLVAFSSEVTTLLPVRRFDDAQKSLFVAAVQALAASGNTAMYDGILASLSMLEEEIRRVPEARPLLFVLTDGETNRGYTFDESARVIEGLQVPVYTISYGEDITELKRLSTLNEAASLKADPGDIAYQIGALLNAEM
jgi:Ca-activated chloride channel family protein